jgi:ABC-type nitrate/sulfonate/bicarbonate transport system substrate-binding protein
MSRGRRQVRGAVIVLGLASLVGTCAHAALAQDAPEGELTQLKVVQDWIAPWVAWFPWTVATEKGWYEDAGLAIEWVVPPTPADSSKFPATGATQLGFAFAPDMLAAASQGLDFVSVASLMDRNPQGIMCWADEVSQPSDLEGRRVAIYNSPVSQMLWQVFADFHGLDTSTIEVITEGNYTVPLILAGAVDCIDAAAAGELVDAQAQAGREAIYFLYDTSNGVPDWYWLNVVANRSWLEQNPEAVRAFIDVTLDGIAYCNANVEECADIFLARHADAGLSRKVLLDGWAELQRFAQQPFDPDQPLGWQDVTKTQAFHDLMVEQKLIETPIEDVGRLVSNDYLPAG